VHSNDDEDKKMPAKQTRSNTKKPATKKETEIHEDKKMPASSQRPSMATPTATGTAATSDTLPWLENLTEEDEETLRNHIFTWLSDNDITLSNNGTFYSESITPPLVQQWLIRQHGAVPATAPPAIAASATPTPDATDDGIAATAAAHAAAPPDEIDDDEDKKMPASRATPPATGAAATSNILPSLDDLFLPEEEKELISDHIIPWLSYNDITLNKDGTFFSDSIIPPVVQQWLIRRGGRPAAAPPSVKASDAAPPPDATDEEIADTVHTWIRSHHVIVRNGVMHCLDPAQSVPKHVQDRVAHDLAQIESLKDDTRKVNRIRQQLPAKRKSPTANTEDNHPSNMAETATTNDPPAAVEAETNPSVPAENSTIEIDAQGDTVEDPIVIDESTSNSDNDSADEADKST